MLFILIHFLYQIKMELMLQMFSLLTHMQNKWISFNTIQGLRNYINKVNFFTKRQFNIISTMVLRHI